MWQIFEHRRVDKQCATLPQEILKRYEKCKDIAAISGLVFKGFPGKPVKDRHLQSSSQLFFDVFNDFEAHNLLLMQAYDEVMEAFDIAPDKYIKD